MSDLKENPVKAAPKKKAVKNITVSQPTGINKLQVKPANAKPTSTKPIADLQPVTKPTKVNQIIIEKIIVHILSPGIRKLTLSGAILDPKTDKDAFVMTKEHIFDITQNDRTCEAIFTKNKKFSACDLSKTACGSQGAFIRASKTLARKLYIQLKKNRSIKECDLVICQYHIKGKPKQKQLAILKLGMLYGLRNQITPLTKSINKVHFTGRQQFTFQDLQKGALVQSCDPKLPCNLLLLDNQTTPLYQKKIAFYFVRKYLESKIAHDSIYFTRLLYENMIDIENELFKAGQYPYVEMIHKLEEYICTQKTYNLAAWMIILKFPAGLVKRVNQLLHPDLKTVVTFPIDLDIFRKYLEHARFRGSNGLTLQVPGNSLSMIILPKVTVKPAKPILITLKTNDWTRLK